MGWPGGVMGTIGEWTEDRLNNWMAQRFNLQGNVRSLVNRAVADAVVPSGVVAYTAASAAPDGWIEAEGQILTQVAYGPLYDAIGTTYNTGGEAAGEFRVPDLRGRGLVGLGTHADVNALTDTDGLAVGSRTPKHAHHTAAFDTGGTIDGSVGDPPLNAAGAAVRHTPWDLYNAHVHQVAAFDTDTATAPYAVGLGIIKL